MGGSIGIGSLLAVVVVSLLAPLVVGLAPVLRAPQVVLLLVGGVLIGPQVLQLAHPGDVQVLSDVGLGFVFLLAGYEVDLELFRQDAGRRATVAWVCTAALSLAVVGGLAAGGVVRAYVPVALAFTTTSLGTVLPVLREKGMLARLPLGRHLLANGAVGELFPILAVALFLGTQNRFAAMCSLAAVVVLAVVLGFAKDYVRPGGRLATVIARGQHDTAQITLRGTVVLLVLLIAVADRFHLDAVLGAFLAGLVLRRWAGTNVDALRTKLDAVGYGFFVPVFFVYSGMRLDVRAVGQAPLRLLLFLGLLLALRGLPVLAVYRRVLCPRERVQTALVAATTLPLLVALTEIGLRNGTMLHENASALVAAGMLSVLIFPVVTVAIDRPPAGPPPGPPLPIPRQERRWWQPLRFSAGPT
jgi:Kef-type K+ transport system membrane component KefB